jgi:hypothetical protein
MVAENIIVVSMIAKFMKSFPMSWLCFMRISSCNKVCATPQRTPPSQQSSHPWRSTRTSRFTHIDTNEDETQHESHRHQNFNTYFNHEKDETPFPSGGEEVEDNQEQDAEEGASEDELALDSFCLPPLSDSRFFLRHKESYTTPSTAKEAACDELTHGINTNSDLLWMLHNPTEESPLRIRGAICKAYRQVKDPMDPNKWTSITDHLDSCGAFDLVQREYLHDIKPAAQYGMHPIRVACLESTTDWYRDVSSERITWRTRTETSTFVSHMPMTLHFHAARLDAHFAARLEASLALISWLVSKLILRLDSTLIISRLDSTLIISRLDSTLISRG